MVGIEGDRAEVRAREEPKVKTVRSYTIDKDGALRWLCK